MGIDACGKILFRAQGWRNLSVSGLASLLFLAFNVWVFMMEIGGTMLLISHFQ